MFTPKKSKTSPPPSLPFARVSHRKPRAESPPRRLSSSVNLKGTPPSGITSALQRLGVVPDEIAICLSTDINPSGEHDVQWLVVTRRWLFVFDPRIGRAPFQEPLFQTALSDISEFRNVPAIGSGILQIRTENVWLDLMRYNNRNKYTFDRLLKRLWQLKRGEDVLPSNVDERDPQRCPECDLMLEFAGELCPRCINHGAAINRVVLLLKPHWKAALVLLMFLLVGVGLDMAWPLLTRYLVDFVLAQPDPNRVQPYRWLAGYESHTLLTLVVAALAAVQAVRGGVNIVTGKISGKVGAAMTFEVRGKLVKKLEELGLAYYSKHESGSLVGRIAYDTDAIQGFMGQITSGFVMQFMLVLISFAMMFSLEPSLALWAMVPAPLVVLGAFMYWRHVHPHFQRYWDRSGKQAGLLNGILSGIRVVKAFAQEQNEFRRFQSASRDVRRSRETLDSSAAYFYPTMGLLFQVGGWVVWYIGGLHVLDKEITLGTLMAFFGYLSLFYGPLGNLTNLTTWLTQFSTQMHRIFEILDTPAVLPEPRDPVQLEHRKGEIAFEDVTFGYSRGVPVVRNLSFTISPGEKVGIVGRSGSGKTSIVNLLSRFYDVESGKIKIDGVDLRDMSRLDLHGRVSMVLQEPFLFRGTLRENIAYGRPDATPEQILTAAKSAGAHEFIMQHPLAYDASVGERGQELSGGERQRISIARALLCEAPILVLDEATSSLDSESELVVQLALDHERSTRRTTLIIAHRLSTLQDCDRILVVERGHLIEQGTHTELLAQNGRYSEWVRIQLGTASIEMNQEGKAARERKRRSFAAAPGGLPSPASFDVRWLRPEVDSFERGLRSELQLHVPGEGVHRGVFALRCFPVHQPNEYLSIRGVDDENRAEELGIVRDLNHWPRLARHLLSESLNRRYFLHTIERIYGVRKFASFLTFIVKTDLGRMEFMIRQDPEAAQDYGPDGKLLMDIEDNLYVIPNIKNLSPPDREVFNRYIYW